MAALPSEVTMHVAAFLPAKGTSQRIPNKNTMLLDGEPLFMRSLKKLLACPSIDEVYLDTESHEIITLAADLKHKVLRRQPELAGNQADGNMLFLNEVNHTQADICVQLLGTSPFLRIETIERAIQVLKEDPTYDCAIAVKKEKQYLWKDGQPCYNRDHIPNSVDLPDTLIETMGLYVMRREAAIAQKGRLGRKPFLLEVDPLEAIDVNWPADFELANLIAVGLREQERRLLDNVKHLLSSPLLSDLLDDLGIHSVLSKAFRLNFEDAKVLGRAKTMQIDPCKDDDDYRGIYDSLHLYDHVVSNDIVVVANNMPDYAFFGELNANLALRAGAQGAIIDGVTRDTAETRRILFPVFAKGHYCKDTRSRGTVTSRNRSVVIDGVTIHKDDLIFGDVDGIVVIPKRVEKEVLAKALDRMQNERLILVDIARGAGTDELVRKYGLF